MRNTQRIQPQLITPISALWHVILSKKNAFLRDTVNKYLVINVILTELKKPGCKAFHLYDDADTDITKLCDQSSLKCLITEISENWCLLVLLMPAIIQNHCTFKVTKSKTMYKTILCLLFSRITTAITSIRYAISNLFRT